VEKGDATTRSRDGFGLPESRLLLRTVNCRGCENTEAQRTQSFRLRFLCDLRASVFQIVARRDHRTWLRAHGRSPNIASKWASPAHVSDANSDSDRPPEVCGHPAVVSSHGCSRMNTDRSGWFFGGCGGGWCASCGSLARVNWDRIAMASGWVLFG
jgi:hypothetical protein